MRVTDGNFSPDGLPTASIAAENPTTHCLDLSRYIRLTRSHKVNFKDELPAQGISRATPPAKASPAAAAAMMEVLSHPAELSNTQIITA